MSFVNEENKKLKLAHTKVCTKEVQIKKRVSPWKIRLGN